MPRLFVFVSVLLGALLVSAPSGAIETDSFGLDVAERSPDARLHIPLRAGQGATGRILVWNKKETPLVLRLSVVPATVDANGKAGLGGDDDEAVAWVGVADEVELTPGERRVVDIDVRSPRKLDRRTRTVAIVAEPAPEGGDEAPAVVQRLALTTFLEPEEGSLIASLGAFPWIALVVLLVVVALALRTVRGRRGEGRRTDIG